jgi:dipeptidyl aminopeptidase/acylaminoacyl peptidase
LDEYRTLLDALREKFTDYTVRFVDQTQDGRTVLVKMSAPYDPGGLYIYSYGDELPSELSPMYRGLKSDDLGNVVAVRYTARDGEKIPAFVTMPPSITSNEQFKNVPFIVLPHGGPYARDAKRFDYFAQFFASRGYGVLQMNFRGSEGYGKSFSEAGRSNWVVMQEEVEDGARWLIKKGYADPNRTCIAGWSYGGYAALMGVAKHSDLYKCAIAMAALTDIEDAKRDLKKYRGGKHAAKTFFGEAFEDKDLRRANSPVRVADQIKVPVFLAHGDKDINVQFDQFTRMKRAMDKAGVKATYLKFEDEDHHLSRQENREAFFVEMEKFLMSVNGTSEFMLQ